jgi:transcriptional regulator with XRE-family HTH domain
MARATTGEGADAPRLDVPLGFLLRAWRRRRGISQAALAQRVGLSTRHLSFLENGRASPTRESLAWLAQALELEADEHAQLVEAAGFVSGLVPADQDSLGAHRAQVERMLRLLPTPALVHDRMGTILAVNDAFRELAAPFVEISELAGQSSGHQLLAQLAPLLDNQAELAEFFRRRVLAGALLGGAADTAFARLDGLMGPPPEAPTAPAEFALPLRLRLGEDVRQYLLVTATLGVPPNIQLRNLRLALILPDAGDV